MNVIFDTDPLGSSKSDPDLGQNDNNNNNKKKIMSTTTTTTTTTTLDEDESIDAKLSHLGGGASSTANEKANVIKKNNPYSLMSSARNASRGSSTFSHGLGSRDNETSVVLRSTANSASASASKDLLPYIPFGSKPLFNYNEINKSTPASSARSSSDYSVETSNRASRQQPTQQKQKQQIPETIDLDGGFKAPSNTTTTNTKPKTTAAASISSTNGNIPNPNSTVIKSDSIEVMKMRIDGQYVFPLRVVFEMVPNTNGAMAPTVQIVLNYKKPESSTQAKLIISEILYIEINAQEQDIGVYGYIKSIDPNVKGARKKVIINFNDYSSEITRFHSLLQSYKLIEKLKMPLDLQTFNKMNNRPNANANATTASAASGDDSKTSGTAAAAAGKSKFSYPTTGTKAVTSPNTKITDFCQKTPPILPYKSKFSSTLTSTKTGNSTLKLSTDDSYADRDSTTSLVSPIKKKLFVHEDDIMILYPPSTSEESKPVGQVTIIRNDLSRLNDGEFLNDSIIEFYAKYIDYNLTNKDYSFFFFNSFFYKKLCSKDDPKDAYKEVIKWTKEDIFEKDFIFIPINQYAHWSLMIVCYPGYIDDTNFQKRPCMLYLDSLNKKPREIDNSSNNIFQRIRKYLTEEWNEKRCGKDSKKYKPRSFTSENFKAFCPHVPIQNNFSDCGVFLLHYMELFCKSPEQNFYNPLERPNWFRIAEIHKKRRQIRSLIFKIRKQQYKDSKTEEEEMMCNVIVTRRFETTSTPLDSSSLEILSSLHYDNDDDKEENGKEKEKEKDDNEESSDITNKEDTTNDESNNTEKEKGKDRDMDSNDSGTEDNSSQKSDTEKSFNIITPKTIKIVSVNKRLREEKEDTKEEEEKKSQDDKDPDKNEGSQSPTYSSIIVNLQSKYQSETNTKANTNKRKGKDSGSSSSSESSSSESSSSSSSESEKEKKKKKVVEKPIVKKPVATTNKKAKPVKSETESESSSSESESECESEKEIQKQKKIIIDKPINNIAKKPVPKLKATTTASAPIADKGKRKVEDKFDNDNDAYDVDSSPPLTTNIIHNVKKKNKTDSTKTVGGVNLDDLSDVSFS